MLKGNPKDESLITPSASQPSSPQNLSSIGKDQDENQLSILSEAQTSLKEYTKSVSNLMANEPTVEKFVSMIEEMDLSPLKKKMDHPDRGVMNIIRTKNNLPGTRYLHAQFFGEGDNQILQHLSFEYQKGEKSFVEAIEEVKSRFPLKLNTEYQSDGFISWDVGEDHNLWIKELTKKDMQNDPFNAYDYQRDLGTIRVAIELKVH